MGPGRALSSGSVETVFFACAADQIASSVRVLGTGDLVDLDGDLVADATISDVGISDAAGPSLDLAEDGRVQVGVDLLYGEVAVKAIIAVDVSQACALFHDDFELGTTAAWDLVVP